MIVGTAAETLTRLRHHAVQVTIETSDKGYIVMAEETWTKLGGFVHLEPAKKATVEFATLDSLLETVDEICDGVDSFSKGVDFSPDLLEQAIRSAVDQIDDLLLFHGAAHLEDDGSLMIDWDEDSCRRLIKEAADE
jgi:hypothetical protein